MNLSGPFIHRPVATTLLTVAIALAGALAFRALPVAPLPEVDFPTISVAATLPGASAEIMASAPRRWASGEDSCLAHTTVKKVLQLRKLYQKGDLTQAMLAERFGLSLSNVKSILGHRSWKHI